MDPSIDALFANNAPPPSVANDAPIATPLPANDAKTEPSTVAHARDSAASPVLIPHTAVVDGKEEAKMEAGQEQLDRLDRQDRQEQREQRERKRRYEQTARKHRALQDPIYFIDHEASALACHFRVLGTSGTDHTINFFCSRRPATATATANANTGSSGSSGSGDLGGQHVWKCTCRDFAIKRRPCKHIQFVWYRVLGIDALTVDVNGPFFDSVAAVQERVANHRVLYEHSIHHHTSPVSPDSSAAAVERRAAEAAAAATVVEQKAVAGGIQQRPFVGENCPICYDVFAAGDSVYFCDEKCGNSVHRACYEACVQFTKKTQCPYCRANMTPAGLNNHNQPRKRTRRLRY